MATADPRNGRPVRSRLKIVGSNGVSQPAVNSEQTKVAPQATSAEAEEYIWDDDLPLRDNFATLGEHLAKRPHLFRRPVEGLFFLRPDGKSTEITTAADLAPVMNDLLRLVIKRDGKRRGGHLPAAVLNAMLRSDVFRAPFVAVDRITTIPLYLPNFRLTIPGYNDGGEGHRIWYVGSPPKISNSLTLINAFLDVMGLQGANRANAVAAIVTVMLHNHWPGGKPIIVVTATKSHAGKDTVILFAIGVMRHISISYQSKTWAVERNFVGATKLEPDVAVIVIENARLDGREPCIASAFIERFATDPEPFLFSTGTGRPVRRRNDIVLAISTNFGSLSEDIMNRSLPVHLAPVGSRPGCGGNHNQGHGPGNVGNKTFQFLFH